MEEKKGTNHLEVTSPRRGEACNKVEICNNGHCLCLDLCDLKEQSAQIPPIFGEQCASLQTGSNKLQDKLRQKHVHSCLTWSRDSH
jgi:hypothetical protein